MSAKLNTLNVIIIKLFIFINKREIGTHKKPCEATTSRRDLQSHRKDKGLEGLGLRPVFFIWCLECSQFEPRKWTHRMWLWWLGVQTMGWALRKRLLHSVVAPHSPTCDDGDDADDKNQQKCRRLASQRSEMKIRTTLDTAINQAICLINVQLRTFRCNLF